MVSKGFAVVPLRGAGGMGQVSGFRGGQKGFKRSS